MKKSGFYLRYRFVETTAFMLPIVLALFITASCDNTSGPETWAKSYSTENRYMPESIIQAKDGGFIFHDFTAGGFTTNDNLIKINEKGSIEWQKQIDPGEVGSFVEMAQGDIIAASRENESHVGSYLTKLSAQGDLIWNKYYNGAMFRDIAPDKSGQFIFAVDGTPSVQYVSKISADGTVIWSKSVNAEVSLSRFVAADSDGGCFIALDNRNSGTKLLRFGPDGDLVWSKSYLNDVDESGFASPELTSLGQTTDGGCVLTLEFCYENIILALRVDANGNRVWARELTNIVRPVEDSRYLVEGFAGPFIQRSSIVQATDGGFAVAAEGSRYARYSYIPGYYEQYTTISGNIIKLDADGAVLWSREYRNSVTTIPTYFPEVDSEIPAGVGTLNASVLLAYSFAATADGGYILLGQLDKADPECVVMKTDEEGGISGTNLKIKKGTSVVVNDFDITIQELQIIADDVPAVSAVDAALTVIDAAYSVSSL
ncbi:MAG: PQQ-binding-like beta-propeller repeat protein [Spirochaetes bacterium]|nr:PQQ-binding-like beta-propeller repeat protein [Spirochaetota bacterium]